MWVVGLFRPLVAAVATPAGERPVLGALEPTALGRWVIDVGASALLLVVLLGVFFGTRAWTGLTEGVRARVLRYHLAPMRSVFKWLTTNPPPLQYSDLEYETRIVGAFDVETTQRYTIAATTDPIFALGVMRGGSPAAPGIEAVKFEASVVGSATWRISVMPAMDQPNEKRWVLLLLPPLLPGGSPLRIQLVSRWPRAAEGLRTPDGEESFTLTVSTRNPAPVDRCRLRVVVDADSGDYEFEPEFSSALLNGHAPSTTARSFEVQLERVPAGGRAPVRVRRKGGEEVGVVGGE